MAAEYDRAYGRVAYGALAVAIIAAILAVWAAWEARTASLQMNETATQLDRIEALQADQRSSLDALRDEVQELSGRVGTFEQASPSPQAVPPPSSPAEQLPELQDLPPDQFDLTR